MGRMPDLHQKIGELEDEIAALSARADQCRRVELAAKSAAGLGAALFAASLLGIVAFSPAVFIAATSAVLLGLVLYGSNRSTFLEILAAIRMREGARDELIDAARLRLVEAPPRPRSLPGSVH